MDYGLGFRHPVPGIPLENPYLSPGQVYFPKVILGTE